MRMMLWLILAVLVILHHDFWLWEDSSLVMGWCPSGMAWHLMLSVVAAAYWYAVVTFAWPDHLDDESDSTASGTRSTEEGAA